MIEIHTWVLRDPLRPALLALPLVPLLLASFLLVTVGLSSVALPDLTLLPLDGFSTGGSAELRLQHQHARAYRVTFPTGLVALGPLAPLRHDTVDG